MAFGRLASLLVDIVINTRRVNSQLNQVQGQVVNSTRQMRNAITRVGLAASAFLVVKKGVDITIDAVWSSIKAFAELEKQIVGIQKVARFSNATEFAEAYIKLGRELRGVSFSELGQIGGDLARLGVRGGAQGFTDFLKVAAQLKLATGDIDTRQAGEGLGKILQNFGRELNASNALKMSSAINKLADDFAVTSGEILTITQKLSGFANAAGLTAEETLGLVTMIKQTGISSTVVESSITRLLTVLEKTPVTVAQTLGLAGENVDKFAEKVRTKPIAAIQEFFTVLNAMPIDQAVNVLADLELATSRNAVALLNATNRVRDWDKTQRAAIEGSQDTTEFLTKVEQTSATAAAKIQDLENTWEVFKASFAAGESVFGDVLGTLISLLDEATDSASELNDILQFFIRLSPGWGIKEGISAVTPNSPSYKIPQLPPELQSEINRRNAALDAENDAILEGIKIRRNQIRMEQEAIGQEVQFRSMRGGMFQGERFENTIRDRIEAQAKEYKKLFDERKAGTPWIFRQIDIAAEIAIQEQIIAEKKQQELDALRERNRIIDIVNSLPMLENTNEFGQRLGQLNRAFQEALDNLQEKGIGPDSFEAGALRAKRKRNEQDLRDFFTEQGNIGANEFILQHSQGGNRLKEIFSRALQLQEILSSLPAGEKLPNRNVLKFLDPGQGQASFQGLTEAYKQAIEDAANSEVQEDILEALRGLVRAKITDHELQKETNRLLGIPNAILN